MSRLIISGEKAVRQQNDTVSLHGGKIVSGNKTSPVPPNGGDAVIKNVLQDVAKDIVQGVAT